MSKMLQKRSCPGSGVWRPARLSAFALTVFLFCLFAGPVLASESTIKLPLVAVVTTGGTIAEKIDPKTGGAVPAVTGEDLMQSVPGVGKMARFKVVPVANIDSSQMTPALMLKLAHTVQKLAEDPEVAGVIVTHGTDTMEETSFFLDLVLETEKPVVFVGAQRNTSDPFPDGPDNLRDAVVQVLSPKARGMGVTLTMNQYVSAARDVRKTHTNNVMTFRSMDAGFLGYIAFGEFRPYRVPAYRTHVPLPALDAALPEVMLFAMYAGAEGKYLKKAVDDGVSGIVVAAFGLGNVNESVGDAIRYARSKGVPVVISSRCYNGRTYPLYGGPGGGETLAGAGVLFSGGLIPSKSRIMLLLGLTQTKETQSLAKYFEGQ